MHCDLPAYLKRDLRRMVGPYREVYAFHEVNAMRLVIAAVVASGSAAMVEGWGIRRAAQTPNIRKAADLLARGYGWSFFYSRRGDLGFFSPGAS